MVLMAADDSDNRHPEAKAKPKAAPASLSPSLAAPATRTRLHDFTFPTLSWGTHRLLRCAKDGVPTPASGPPPPHPQMPSPQKEKPQGAAGASQPRRPWNLRARRSATAATLAAGSEGVGKFKAWQAQQPLASPRKRGFSVALTKEEIAEDFLAICGARPPRRPKKRPRAVQRLLDVRIGVVPRQTLEFSLLMRKFCASVLNSGLVCSQSQLLYPGLSLADVSLDSYKIEQVRHRWFVRVFLILLHKVGSFLHGPFPLAEVIGAVVEPQIGGAFQISLADFLFLHEIANTSPSHECHGSSGLEYGMLDFQCSSCIGSHVL
jgi:hypothetical protein